MIRSLACTALFTLSCLLEAKDPWTLRGDLLYWQAHEGGLSFGTENGHVKNLSFDHDLGFRGGISFLLPKKTEDLSLLFTHFHTKAFGYAYEELVTTWTKVPLLAQGARARWRLHLGILDGGIGKTFATSRTLSLRPYLGVRTAWVRQKYKIHYFFPGEFEELSMKNKFWGIGLAAGLEGTWELHKRWSFVGKGLFSLLAGEFYIHQDEDTKIHKMSFLSIHDIYASTASTLDLGAGISYRFSSSLKLSLLWEQITLFRQNQFLRFFDTHHIETSGDAMTLQGGTASLEASF